MRKTYFIGAVCASLSLFSCAKEQEPALAEAKPKEYRTSVKYSPEEIPGVLNDYFNANKHLTRSDGFATELIDKIEVVTDGGTTTRSGESVPADTVMYVVNFKNDAGYAFVSGDVRTTPILALSEEGNFNLQDTLTNIVAHYVVSEAKAVVAADIDIANGLTVPDDIGIVPDFPPAFNPLRDNYVVGSNFVEPMLRVAWDQDYPFNKKNPNGSSYNLAGCGAIAVSQLASFWNYPTNWKGSSYNWREMKRLFSNAYEGDFPAAEDQVATFIKNVGDALGTKYGLTSSSTNADAVPGVFRNMGFNCGGFGDYRTDSAINSLRQGRPVLGYGFAKRTDWVFYYTYGDGHAWVIDGYRTITHEVRRCRNKGRWGLECDWITVTIHEFHINFGWGPGYNGYYTSPAAGGYNYQYNQHMLTDIYR